MRVFVIAVVVCVVVFAVVDVYGVIVDNKTYTNSSTGAQWTQDFSWAVDQVNSEGASEITFDLASNVVECGGVFSNMVTLDGYNNGKRINQYGELTFLDSGDVHNFERVGSINATGAYYMVVCSNSYVASMNSCCGEFVSNGFHGVVSAAEESKFVENTFAGKLLRLTHLNTVEDNVFSGTACECGSKNILNNNEGLYLTVTGNANTISYGTTTGMSIGGSSNAVENVTMAGGSGIYLTGTNHTLDGLRVMGSTRAGVSLDGKGHSLKNSVIGRNAGPGVLIEGESITVGDRINTNLIYGNAGGGIKVYQADDVTISGNWIGSTNDDYDAAVSGNIGFGIQVKYSYNVQVGLLEAGRGNVIIGNTGYGMQCLAEEGDNLFFNANLNSIAKNLGHGVEFSGGTNWHFHGNFVGLYNEDLLGEDMGNSGHGIVVINGAKVNIGGPLPTARNIISGNKGCGIYIEGKNDTSLAGCSIRNNYIGTSVGGTKVCSNGAAGIMLKKTDGVQIGGVEAGEGNLISGNMGVGIMLAADEYSQKEPVRNTLILGNLIGVDSNGVNALGNVGGGIYMLGYTNTVGGTNAGARNVISGNGAYGIFVGALNGIGHTEGNIIQGNYIGLGTNGLTAVGNQGDGIALDASGSIYQYVYTNVIGVNVSGGGGNVIAGNSGYGISCKGGVVGNCIDGNFVGTDASGSQAVANAKSGFFVGDGYCYLNSVGVHSGNVFSGNSGCGVELAGGDRTIFRNNHIGGDVSDSFALSNGSHGVKIGTGSRNNEVGSTREQANVIVFNGGNGIDCEGQDNDMKGNYIGLLPSGASGVNAGAYGIRSCGPYTSIGGKEDGAGNMIDGRIAVAILNTGTNSGKLRHYVNGNILGYHPLASSGGTNIEYGIYIQGPASYMRVGAEAENLIGGASVAGIYATNVEYLTIMRSKIGCVTNASGRVGAVGNGIVVENGYAPVLGGAGDASEKNYIDHCQNGVVMCNVSGITFEANMIGCGPDDVSMGISENGISCYDVTGGRIGDAANGSMMIAGCGRSAILLENSSGVRMMGGYFGILPDGMTVKECADGIVLSNSVSCRVGDMMYPNYIVGCTNHGVAVYGVNSASNQLYGAVVGLLPDGAVVGNGGNGVLIQDASAQLVNSCKIAGNGFCGVYIDGDSAVGNQLMNNSIYSNGICGIALGSYTTATNDNEDPDTGPNRLQNYPVVTNVWSGETHIQGTLNSTPDHTFLLQFFANDSVNTNGVAEGQTFLCEDWVMTDLSGNATFDTWSPSPIGSGKLVTAVAVDLDTGDTSPFSVSDSRGVSTAPPDTNGDGMPDYWEACYPVMAAEHSDNESDYDGDGFTDLQEYLAMTDPEDAASFLMVELCQDGIRVPQSSSGRIYVLQVTDGLGGTSSWYEVSRSCGVDYEALPFDASSRTNSTVSIYRIVTEMP